MMPQKNHLADLSDEKLTKRRDLLKGILIGMYIVCVLLIALLVCIFIYKGFENVTFATLIPVMMLPVLTVPLLLQVKALNREIALRKKG